MLVQNILKAKSDDGVVTVEPGDTVGAVAQLLAARKIGAVVVSPDAKTVKGIVSERDIVREISARGAACLTDRVDTIMTRETITCTRSESSDQVLAKMTEGRFRHLPVMEGAEMVGLISIGDVVKAQLAKLEMEKEALEGMIKGF
ncbi:MAG: CBS domain-containing protein [Rhodobacteraceae bacterium]|nr:CBS domain-containing protein [Paracoccaceae bacterium]